MKSVSSAVIGAAPNAAVDQPSAEVAIAHVGFHGRRVAARRTRGAIRPGTAGRPSRRCAVTKLMNVGRTSCDVLEQRRQVGLRGEIAGAAGGERPERQDAAERMVHRHVVEHDERLRVRRAPGDAVHAFAEHGALRRARAARRVVDRRERILGRGGHVKRRARAGHGPWHMRRRASAGASSTRQLRVDVAARSNVSRCSSSSAQ